jgi:hypothetical protein
VTSDLRCYALNREGQRCEEVPGHGGLHRISIEWGDDELFDPTVKVKAAPPAPVVEHLTASPIPSRCALCNHPWHVAACNKMDGDFPCDCASGVPD